MKKNIHPTDYRPVLFIDNSDGTEFIIPSTVVTKETAQAKMNHKNYPTFRVEISSATHPLYTGEVRTLDVAGRVERFKQKRSQATSRRVQGKSKK